jgi:uncharacterized protein YkwD
MNGIAMFLGLLIVQIPAESLGPVENIYTVEYGNVQGRKILNGEYAGQYRIEGQVEISAEQQFLNLVNQHRANHGLGPLSWDQTCAAYAALNNGVHDPQSIYGMQTWAGVTDFVSAFNMWVASPAHNAILLGARSVIGVARCLTGCTANAY